MKHYAGIDVSLECSSVCVVDAEGRIVREDKVLSEPEALVAWFAAFGAPWNGSAWRLALCRMAARGDVERRPGGGAVGDTARARRLQDHAGQDRQEGREGHRAADAARLVQAGALQVAAGAEVRAVLTARKLLQGKLHDVEMCLRGILRGFGLKVGRRRPDLRRTRVRP